MNRAGHMKVSLNPQDEDAINRLLVEHQILLEAIAGSPVYFCVYDQDDRLIAWNETYTSIYPNAFRKLETKIIQREATYADILRCEYAYTTPGDEVEALVQKRVAAQANATGEPVIRQYKDQYLRIHKYRLPSGAVAGLAVNITDLIEREARLEDARLAAEASEAAKARFVATLSHEIRTPMNGITGLTELLSKTELTEQQHNLLETIRNSAQALVRTINEVLDLSKIDAGKLALKFEPFDLGLMLRDLCDLLRPVAEEKSVALLLKRSPREPDWLLGDALRMRQCVTNLLGNAIKFTNEGSVTLSTEYKASGLLRIDVTDTGQGIASDQLEKIFVEYEQVGANVNGHTEGTGLGLAITRKLAEMMNGDLSVKSALGVGSTFTLSLPLQIAEPSPA